MHHAEMSSDRSTALLVGVIYTTCHTQHRGISGKIPGLAYRATDITLDTTPQFGNKRYLWARKEWFYGNIDFFYCFMFTLRLWQCLALVGMTVYRPVPIYRSSVCVGCFQRWLCLTALKGGFGFAAWRMIEHGRQAL
jgi:hypothetical protein